MKTSGLLLGLAVVMVHCLHAQRGAPAAGALHIDPMGVPAPLGSMSPQLTAGSGRAIISWIEGEGRRTSVRFAELTATGWSRPQVVVAGEVVVANPADIPSVRALADGSLVAHWLEANGGGEAYNLRVAWSTDGGRSWRPPTSPHRDVSATQHGFAAFFGGDGRLPLGVAWLDGRAGAASPGAPMMLRAATYSARGEPAGDVLLAPSACDCCPTAAATTADGAIVAFRNRAPGEIRDIYVTRLSSGASGPRWSEPIPVHRDGWKIAGCPVNGPALAASKRDVVVAWFTAAAGTGRALAAFSRDGGRTFAAPIRVDDAEAVGRVQVGLTDDLSAMVAWVEGSQLRVRRVHRGGARGPASLVADGIGRHYPRMVRYNDEWLLAWVENTRGTTRVRTARARMD